ncbi:hypothetical protein A8C56_02315 [Niabella ginsenosidivorans]|uniref:Carbohydrate-binding protein SusD n=1 Tax=Niabella ginsenosidivorans TaxID=1176587 RepID=A0A1A9I091_9BACT|nr:RagB/SusD family nutrient uptake outer membrane protein [Niabella ginsenosidivorans]ANH79964.1 hypothetical protein A8C56_02315 [Niabella ginsenosidivorans]
MKYIYKFYFILSAFIVLSGCKKFVDKKPLDSFSDTDFWTSENALRTYNWEFYNLFIGYGTGASGDFYFSDFSDDQDGSALRNFVANAPATNSSWTFYWVRKANIMLERIDQVPIDDAAKNHWKGVARFFRAMTYFNLVKTFGDVPFINKSLDLPDTTLIYKPRDPRALVMDSVLADLNYAVANLRDADLSNTVNKNIARAFLSRVALFEGTYRKYHTELNLPNAATYLKAAKDAANELMTAGYSLNADYQTTYNSLDLSTNKQVIMFKQYAPGFLTHSVIGYTNSSTTMSGLTKNAVESYLASDGLPISLSPLYKGDSSITTLRQNRDKRLLETIDTVLMYQGHLWNGFSSSTGYRPAKFLQPLDPNQLAPYNSTDAPLFGLPEVLLNYAEACVELDQMGEYSMTQGDLDRSVNLLRARAGVAPLQLSGKQGTAVNGVAFVDPKMDKADDAKAGSGNEMTSLKWEIRRERRTELMMDGFRYDDLMRWKKGWYLDNSKNPDIFLGAKVPANDKINRSPDGYLMVYAASATRAFTDPKNYLSAVPTGQIALYANGNLSQNPGW